MEPSDQNSGAAVNLNHEYCDQRPPTRHTAPLFSAAQAVKRRALAMIVGAWIVQTVVIEIFGCRHLFRPFHFGFILFFQLILLLADKGGNQTRSFQI